MESKIDTIYLRHILDSITKIEKFVNSLPEKDFFSDDLRVSAVLREFEVIGEAARQMPDEYKKLHPEIEWSLMISMRNNLIHHYFGINEEIVWKTYTQDLPILKEKILKLLQT